MNLSPTRPPRAPSRTRPSLALGTCPVRRSLPPAPPAGGVENKTTQLERSLAGTRLRFDSLRSACSPLAHYAPLDRAQSAHLRYTSFRSVTSCPLSRYFPEVYRKAEIVSPPTRPPLTPARSRPSLSLGTCPVRLLAAPRPARGGLEKQTNTMERKKSFHGKKKKFPWKEKKYLPSSSARARGPRAPLAPRLRRSARARFAINTIMNK